jgi:hypothetical protein
MMNKKRFRIPGPALLALIVILLALVACQDEEQLKETELTLEAKARAALQPTSTPAPTETPTQEPTEAPEEVVEPTPTAAPASMVDDMEEYVSVTEFFSLKVPAGWSSEETFPGGAFVMANSEAALERYKSGDAVTSGDFVLNVGFLPYDLFEQREVKPLGIQFEATPDVFLQSLLPMFNIKGGAALSDVDLVSISNERDAGMLAVSEEEREGMILMFVAGDGVVAFVSTVGFPGEMADFQEAAYAIAAEMSFGGAHQALYGQLLRG